MTIPESPRELISRWHKRSREIQHSQYETGKKLRSQNEYFGIAVLIINVIVASSIFISIKSELGDIGKIISGLLTLAAALFAGLQTFLKLSEKAEKHQSAGYNAGALRRKIEQTLANDITDIPNDEVNKLREEFDKVSKDAPSVPSKIWKETEEKIKGDQ
jgi:hypothetical protein